MTAARSPRRRILLGAVAMSALTAAAVLAPAAAGLAAERPLAERPLPVLRVQGEGEKAAAPDMAVLTFGVLREAATAREALDANNSAMAAVIEAVKAEGIEARDIQTAGFSIQPRYTQPTRDDGPQAPRIDGYSVSNDLTVRVRDLSRLGAVLDKVVTLGVNSGGDIAFANDDPTAIIAQARAEAMKDAAARAGTLAEAAGVKLGQILEISENYNPPRPMALGRAKMMMDSASAVPVEAGESSYSVSVQVSWEIIQ